MIFFFQKSYQAVVVRNPVIDLNTMVGTSDITDWLVKTN